MAENKVFVCKLVPELKRGQIKRHFAQFGAIAKMEQPFDIIKNERKRFCFITFVYEDDAKNLLKQEKVYINGHELDVKKVLPKKTFENEDDVGRGDLLHPGISFKDGGKFVDIYVRDVTVMIYGGKFKFHFFVFFYCIFK